MRRKLLVVVTGLVVATASLIPVGPAKAHHAQPEFVVSFPALACWGYTYTVGFVLMDKHWHTPYTLDVDYNVYPGPADADTLTVFRAYTSHIEYHQHRWTTLGHVQYFVQGLDTDPWYFQPDKAGSVHVVDCGVMKLAPYLSIVRHATAATPATIKVTSTKDDNEAHTERLMMGDGTEQTIFVPARYQNGVDTGAKQVVEIQHHYEYVHPDDQRSENEPVGYYPAAIRADGRSDFGYTDGPVLATCY